MNDTEIDVMAKVYDEIGCVFLVRPNPDVPDAGLLIRYEGDDEGQDIDLFIGKQGAERLIEALRVVLDHMK